MLNRPPLATSALLLLKASPLSSRPLRSCSELRSKQAPPEPVAQPPAELRLMRLPKAIVVRVNCVERDMRVGL